MIHIHNVLYKSLSPHFSNEENTTDGTANIFNPRVSTHAKFIIKNKQGNVPCFQNHLIRIQLYPRIKNVYAICH